MNYYSKTAENYTANTQRKRLKFHLHLPAEISSLAQQPQLDVIIKLLRKRAFSLDVSVVRKIPTPFNFSNSLYAQYKNIINTDLIHLIISPTSHLIPDLFFPVLLSRILGKKVVVQISEQSLSFIPSYFLNLSLKILVFADAVVVPTERLKTRLIKNKISAFKIYPFVSGNPEPETRPPTITPKIFVISDKLSVDSYLAILKLFKYIKEKYPRSELTFSGCKEKLIELQMYKIEHHILSVNFETSNSTETLIKNIKNNEIIINLSQANSFPDYLLEAISDSKIVISEKNEISEEFLETGKLGFLFDEEKYEQLTKILYQLIESPAPVAKISSNLKEFNKKFSKSRFVDSWEEIFSRLI